jgi:hypothetical protein
MSAFLAIATAAGLVAWYAGKRIEAQNQAYTKWHRFFETGAIRRM